MREAARPANCLLRAAALVAALSAGSASAGDESLLGEITISAAGADLLGIADAASEGTVSARQLGGRPLLRPAEVMEAVPGMIVTQHSGDGKANQYFLRGFNLDHGSDFSTRVLGMPVNLPTHAHGQGYMDLNFLIPELIAGVRYRKGSYAAEDGDFATSGSAQIDYKRRLDAPFVEFGIGQYGYRRLLAAGSREVQGLSLLAAVEAAGNDGPWVQPAKLHKTNAVLRLSGGTARDGFALSGLFYEADWRASEHVPARAVASGEIGRYGTLLANDGGQSRRYSLSGEWAWSDAMGGTRASLYLADYRLRLFSGASGYIKGAQGDQHEQADQRITLGGALQRAWQLPAQFPDTTLSVGLQWRQDDIARVGLYDTVNRQRTQTVREDRVLQNSLGAYLEAKSQWTPWLRSSLAVRHDALHAVVTPLAGPFNGENGGRISAGQTSPRLGVVFGPFSFLGRSEFYANAGRGFHSNDARGATQRIDPQTGLAASAVPLVVPARSAEIGLRATPLPGWETTLSLWQMALASELVFIGDEGITEPKGASRRHGLEWTHTLQAHSAVLVDAAIAVSQARFRQTDGSNGAGGSRVPNAIPLTASLALAVDAGGPWSGALRFRYLGAYPLEESGHEKSRPFWAANLRLAYRLDRQAQVALDVLNLFDSKANDIEYWGGACSRAEHLSGVCGGGIEGRLVHPLEPRTLRVSLRLGL